VKRFLAPPSPLPCVQWWRLCLDEAQMVECTGSKTAEMARRLGAVHRWAITGTPVQKSVHGESIVAFYLFTKLSSNHVILLTRVFCILISHFSFLVSKHVLYVLKFLVI